VTATEVRTFKVQQESEWLPNFKVGEEIVELQFKCRDSGIGIAKVFFC
jgi:hypothetical protein